MYYYDGDDAYLKPLWPQSGHEAVDCVCLLEGDTDLRVKVEATHYWATGNADERGELPPEHDIYITEIRLIGSDVVVDEHDLSLLTGMTDEQVEQALQDQVEHYLKTGEDESIKEQPQATCGKCGADWRYYNGCPKCGSEK